MERRAFRVTVVVMYLVFAFSIIFNTNAYANTDVSKYGNAFYSNTNLTNMTGMSKDEFVEYCKGMKYDKTGFYQRNAEYIYDACKKYGFNELGFIGISAWEGGWCQYGISYNYYGLGSYRFSSEREGIDFFISYLTNNYLSENGKYYKGKTIKDINKCYNTVNPEWYWKVIDCIQSSTKRK